MALIALQTDGSRAPYHRWVSDRSRCGVADGAFLEVAGDLGGAALAGFEEAADVGLELADVERAALAQ